MFVFVVLFVFCVIDKLVLNLYVLEKVQQIQGVICMFLGVYFGGLCIIDSVQCIKFYVQMEYIGDLGKEKLMFLFVVVCSFDLMLCQMNCVLMDMIFVLWCFDVLLMDNMVMVEQLSFQIIVLVIDVYQKFELIEGGCCVVVSCVKLLLQIKDFYIGELLQDCVIVVEGQSGLFSGDCMVLGLKDDLNSFMVQQSLVVDYKNVLYCVFKEVVICVGEIFWLFGKVVLIDVDSVGLLGGI